jgi:alkylated DNA nucleotide flippase Atl1
MTTTSEPIADFFEDMGKACLRFADGLRPMDSRLSLDGQASLADLELGTRQQQIVEVLGDAGEAGMRAAEIAKAISGEQANTHTSITGLATRGVVEKIASDDGPRWRLAPRYRGVSDPYLRMAGHVRAGEWTTYGDISIAVRGDTKAARAVGQAAAMLHEFPSPHRVLWSGGRIPPTWRTPGTAEPTPQVCRHRLVVEGVPFDTVKGTAGRDHYVSWDVLVERDEQEG